LSRLVAYKKHPSFPEPAPSDRVWRYLDFTKFVALLERKVLYFSRVDLLGDRFEGCLSRANISQRTAVYADLIAESGEEKWQKFQQQFHDMIRGVRRHTYVNCWHVGNEESAAMWGLYTRPDQGIAIRSTFERLTRSLRTDGDVFVGKVTYLDYESDWLPEGNTLNPFVHKRRSYSFESELRAVIQDLPRKDNGLDLAREGPPGVEVPVELKELIEQVCVSPTAPSWFLDLVKTVVVRYDHLRSPNPLLLEIPSSECARAGITSRDLTPVHLQRPGL
jgi:hypothetical protein